MRKEAACNFGGELKNQNNFDIAFALLTSKANNIDWGKTSKYVIKQAVDISLWGPESALLSSILIKLYKKHALKHIKKIQSTFNLKDDISVDANKATKALKATKNIGKEIWKDAEKKTKKVLEATTERSLKFFTKQTKKKKKQVKKANDEEAYAAFISDALSDHVKVYTETFPKRILHPEVKRLVKLVETNVALRAIDTHALGERILTLHKLGEDYLKDMSDVQVGRAWTYTGVELAYQNEVAEYVIVAQMDSVNKPCLPCQALDGQHFSVVKTREVLRETLALTDPEEIKNAAPFPRFAELTAPDMTPEKISEHGYSPPFHNQCRCEIIFL